ncbi:MAG: histone deacetylase [Mucilaginibacter polytrichastri]|nr:histone deacetylase [Mucilaginibacter polytrichastri]
MLYVAFDPVYAHPLPPGHRFPMLKYELIPEQLLHEGVISEADLHSPAPLDEAMILWTHEKEYWKRLRGLQLSKQEERRSGFPVTHALVEREIRIARGTIDGCLHALKAGIAFNVAGGTHHAGSNWAEGFCLLNDQAIAANFLIREKHAKRILIIDLDVHQGNGTAEIFYGRDDVFTFSMHGAKNFPFRKERSDLDIPLENGTGDDEYLHLLKTTLPGLFDTVRPDFVFYLAGVDVLASDALGKLSMSRLGCRQRDEEVFSLCKIRGVPVQVSMGGGYSPGIRDIVDAHCNTYKAAAERYT